MGSFGKGLLTFLEAVGESIEAYNKYDKEASINRVKNYTTYSIAEHYRALINDVNRMTEKEKELVFAELAVQFGQQDKLKGVEQKAERLERENRVLRAGQQQVAGEWTKEEIKEFDGYYRRYATGLYEDDTESEIAQHIYGYSSSKLKDKSLLEIMQRVQQYKSMGL